MKIEILNEKENSLLNRKEIKFRILYEGATPSIKEVREKLIPVLNSEDNLTIVDSIVSTFGGRIAGGYAKVYKDKEGMKVEPKHRIKKNFGIEEKKEEVEKENVGEKREVVTEEKFVEKKRDVPPKKKKEKTEVTEVPAEEKKGEVSSEEKSEVKKKESGKK